MPLLAYIDPGTGSMILQVVLAGILSVPFFFRRTISDGWRRMRGNGSNDTSRDEDTAAKP